MVGLGRLELPTSRLSGVRSNRAELQARMIGPCPAQIRLVEKKTSDQAIWIGQIRKGYEDGGKFWRSKYCKGIDFKQFRDKPRNIRNLSLKGGDPAAGSPTATLLRLHPSRSSDLGRLLPEG